jgi:phytoene dehydrogenase-like protein
MEDLRDSYDLVVIGGGAGGLVAGALAAAGGLHVLLAEAHTAPGGLVHSFEREPYVFDPAVHLLVDPPHFERMLDYLGVGGSVQLIRPSHFYTALAGGTHVHAPFAAEDFVQAHVTALPHAADEVRAFFGVCAAVHEQAHGLAGRMGLRELGAHAGEFELLMRYRRASVGDVLNETVSDPEARVICGVPAIYLGLPPSRLAFQTFAQMLFSHIVHGGCYVQGGVQRLIDALAESINLHGGQVRCGTRVTEVHVRDGRVDGVTIDGETRVGARAVVSNADPFQTLRLVGEEHLGPLPRRLRRLRLSVSAFMVFVASRLDLTRVEHAGHLTMYSRELDVDRGFDRSLDEGRPYCMTCVLPTLVDPSTAPTGEHQLIPSMFARYDIGRPWREAREAQAEAMLEELETIYPGVRAALTFVENSTPETLERFTLNHRGAIYGWENSPDQTRGRPDQRTAVDGLYLAGSWTAPGSGFVRAVMSGRGAADRVLDRAGVAERVPQFMS